jgi:phosphoribosylglycinamide formyltransferase-1
MSQSPATEQMNKRIVILASGTGSLAARVMQAVAANELALTIVGVISDKPSKVLEVAQSFELSTHYLPVGSDRAAWNLELLELTRSLQPDLVVSLGFMRILAPDYVAEFEVINTHPSLLPLFPGAHAVRDALAAGASVTGSTVHRVDAGMDTGPIIAQVEVPVRAGVSESELHEEIKIVERALIVEVLKTYAAEGAL